MNKQRGFKVQKMRELMGKKQIEVARGLGINQNSYSAWEAGKVEISDEMLDKVAEIIGTTAEAIEAYDEGKIVNFVNNHTGNVNVAGSNHATIYTCEDVQKIVDMAVAPWKELVASLEKQTVRLNEQIAMQHEQIMLLLGQRKGEG